MSQITSITESNKEYSNTQNIANALNSFCASAGRNISNSYDSDDYYTASSSMVNSFYLKLTTESECSDFIEALINNPCHISTYPIKVLKKLNPNIWPVLSKIIRRSLLTGHFPSSSQKARVVPIYQGGSLNEMNNYRMNSVLPVLSKVFERTVFIRLSHYLEQLNLLREDHYGFRTGKTTSDAIMVHLDFVFSYLGTDSIVVSFFLDCKKLFDCIDHSIHLAKPDSLGIRIVVKQWFQSYLTKRQQFVSLDHVESDKSLITHGVPLG